MSAPTVLIVEDNPKNRKIMADLLRHNGYRFIEAEDGQAGVEKAIAERPDLILMDIQLPRMDGYEATRRLRANDATRGIPIIVITSFAMKDEEARARAAGCDEYMTKPIDIHAFVATVKRYAPPRGE
ncbi:MAG TPA: response regulator [Spirochaetota bacterium]|nr:response regulator [Spirochaetota bacterium]